MNDKIMAEEVKPETKVAFANRKYSNEDKRKMEEEELEQLMAEQKGETTEATKEVVEAEPANAEEKSFKKRYGDLRRHMQDKEKDWDDKFKTLQRQLEDSTKQEIKLPKSDGDIEAWAEQYPDVAAIVETIAIKKAKEQAAGLEERVKEIDEMKADAARKKAEVELMTAHPDFDEIRDDDAFHNWVDEQPKWVQDALYENASDSRSAARAIDLYKADMNIQTKKPASNNKDAARSVNSRSNATPDSEDSKNVFKESQVNKMTAQQYEKASDAIMESIRTGKFIYDMSGNAR
ncbi:MAG: hypothetical protein CMJ25_00645 [Phycisphaerae bacterium]|nr:hypothetical protein [Phycisphaerae bacterium]